MDTACLGGRSAYEYWHTLCLDGSPRLGEGAPVTRDAVWLDMRPVRLWALPDRLPSDRLIRLLLEDELRGFRQPVELLVSSAKARGRSALKTCRVWGGPVAAGTCVRVGARLYVSTPEFLALQMARTLSLAELLAFLYELCGFYAVRHWGYDAAIRCRPASSEKLLRSFVGRMDGAPGVKGLRRALRFVRDGSGSPMETVMVLLLCLPHKLGGYGIPFPAMNGAVDIPEDLQGALGGRQFFCDAYWRDRRFALEYDGRLYHEGSERVHRDYVRANGLRALGVGTEVVTMAEVGNVVAFDAVARRVARALGVQLRGLDCLWEERRRNLRGELLGCLRDEATGDAEF